LIFRVDVYEVASEMISVIYSAVNAGQYVLSISRWSLDGTSIGFRVTQLIQCRTSPLCKI